MPDEVGIEVGSISLEEILGRRGASRPSRPLPQPEATACTLAERLKELEVHYPAMRHGDLVTYKNGWDPRREKHKNQPMLLLLNDAPEDYSDEAFGSIIGRGDVIAAFLHTDGTAIMTRTDRRFLEPWPRAGGDLPVQEDEE